MTVPATEKLRKLLTEINAIARTNRDPRGEHLPRIAIVLRVQDALQEVDVAEALYT